MEGIDADTLRKKNVVLIPRNSPLPARYTERFATKSEDQRSIAITVLEGESPQPAECFAIGRTVVRDLPSGLPKGWPVEITFQYGTNGRLEVDALVPGTQHKARLELIRESGLSHEGLARWKQPVSEAGGFSTFESVVEDVLQSTPPHGPSPSGIDSAIGWSPVKTDVAGAAVAASALNAMLPAPSAAASTRFAAAPIPLAVSPASLAAGHWHSGPQAPTDTTPSPMQEEQGASEAEVPRISRSKPEKKRRIPKWIERLIGHAVVLALFALVAYLMISHVRPDLLRSVFGGSAQPKEQKQADPTP